MIKEIAQISTGSMITICVSLVIIVAILTAFLRKTKVKYGNLSIGGDSDNNSSSYCKDCSKTGEVELAVRSMLEYEKDFQNGFFNYLQGQIISLEGKFPSIIPKLWRLVFMNCITDTLTEAVIHNHLDFKLTEKDTFKTWVSVNDSKIMNKWEMYKSCASKLKDDIGWLMWFELDKNSLPKYEYGIITKTFDMVFSEIKYILYFKLRNDYLDFCVKCRDLFKRINDNKTANELYQDFSNRYNKIKEGYIWFKDIVPKIEIEK